MLGFINLFIFESHTASSVLAREFIHVWHRVVLLYKTYIDIDTHSHIHIRTYIHKSWQSYQLHKPSCCHHRRPSSSICKLYINIKLYTTGKAYPQLQPYTQAQSHTHAHASIHPSIHLCTCVSVKKTDGSEQ